jgi:alginate O-acetyltransferase complex protein AlgI
MIFNSVVFLVFFVCFFILYWFVNNRLPVSVRNAFIISASYLFYGWWDWRFLSLIVFSSALDFAMGLLLDKENRPKRRKLYLAISLAGNLGILGFFKYFNFFASSLQAVLAPFSIHPGFVTLHIVLPVGISFYTFQTLSYTLDVYQGKMKPTRDMLSFFAFVSFFPQLVAGPIERASRLLLQFAARKTFSYENSVYGLRLALWGFFKKIVIADNFGVLTDHIFSSGQPASGLLTIVGSLFFALQIYADFSGYSDIAIGIAKMLGFDLMQNFATPYFATSFGEFWHRWHISLSTWFRDYVYIPLGGNRGTKARVSSNIMITFLLSGLWHGADIIFLIWGGLHGAALVAEKRIKRKLNKTLYAAMAMAIIILLWIPFRAKNYSQFVKLSASLVQCKTYSFSRLYQELHDFSLPRFYALLAVTAFFLLIEYHLKWQDFSQWISGKSRTVRLAFYYLILVLIFVVGNFSVKPYFIYFQF